MVMYTISGTLVSHSAHWPQTDSTPNMSSQIPPYFEEAVIFLSFGGYDAMSVFELVNIEKK